MGDLDPRLIQLVRCADTEDLENADRLVESALTQVTEITPPVRRLISFHEAVHGALQDRRGGGRLT